MTTERSTVATDIRAGADLTGDASLHKAIAIGGTIAANNSTAIGLLKSKGASGQQVRVAWFGEMKGVAGAAVTAGDKVSVTTSGFLITSPASTNPIGKALETAASGDLVRIIANFAQGLWS